MRTHGLLPCQGCVTGSPQRRRRQHALIKIPVSRQGAVHGTARQPQGGLLSYAALPAGRPPLRCRAHVRAPPGMKQPFSGGAQGNIISPVPWTEAPAAPAGGRPTSAKRFPWVPGTDISKPEDVAFLRQESPMFRKHLRRIQSPSLPFSPTAPGERTFHPLFSARQSGVLAKIPTQAARQRAFPPWAFSRSHRESFRFSGSPASLPRPKTPQRKGRRIFRRPSKVSRQPFRRPAFQPH